MAKLKTDTLETWLEYKVDTTHRIVRIFGEINEERAELAVTGIYALDKASDQPMTILLSTEGGHEDVGMAIYDAIKCCRSEVTIRVYGRCLSIGAWILQAAEHRLLEPNSTMMLHTGTNSYEEHHKKTNRAWMKNEEVWDKKMINLILEKIKIKRPEMTYAKLKKLLDDEWILTPDEAVEWGLADRVIDPLEDFI